MRKFLTCCLTLSLGLAGCGGPETSPGGNPGATGTATAELNATTSTMTYTENYLDTRLLAGAGAEVLYSNGDIGWSNVYLHYGFNGWTNVADVPLKIDDPSSPFLHAHLPPIPSTAKVLDFAVYTVRADGSKLWDNNRGRDYHVDVFSSVADATPSGSDLKITYVGKLTPVKLHWGKNNWQSPTDTLMVKDTSVTLSGGLARWTATLAGQATATQLDFCFTNGSGAWDNNATKNWIFVPGTTSLTITPSNFGAFYQPDLEGAPVTAWLNGKWAGSFNLGTSGSYFWALGSGGKGDWKFVLDTIAGGRRYTATTTQRITASSQSVYLTIQSTPWGQ